MSYPDFVCIGATKAGTTWLGEQLSKHPQIGMPVIKELHYFSSCYMEGERNWAGKAVDKAMAREQAKLLREVAQGALPVLLEEYIRELNGLPKFSDQWYQKCFSRPDHVGRFKGEITPAYAELPSEGIEALIALNPGVKIIHMIRDPLDRAMSHLRMAIMRRNPDPVTLLDFVKRNPQIVSRGAYQLHVPAWKSRVREGCYSAFPFGDIGRAPTAMMKSLELFLSVREYNHYSFAKKVNATRPVDVPDEVIDYLREQVAPAADFLRKEFGEAFNAKIK